MTARVARIALVAVVAAITSSTARAGAATAPPPIRLSWTRGGGADTCIDQGELERRVSARLGRIPFSESGTLTISGGVTREGEFFRAVIDVRDGSGRALGHRDLESPSADCAPLGDAVVLAVALTIDPEAATSSAPNFPATAPVVTMHESAPAEECPVAAPSLATAPRTEVRPSDSVVESQPCPAPPRTPNRRLDVQLLASFAGALGLLPGAAPGVAVEGRGGRGAFSGFLGLSYFPEKSSSDPRVDFGLMFASAGGCYGTAFPDSELSFCAGLEVGAIHAVVKQIAPVRPGDQPWVAAEFGPRFVFQGLAPLILEARISGVVPLDHEDFELVGQAPFFREARFGALGSLGVGIGSL